MVDFRRPLPRTPQYTDDDETPRTHYSVSREGTRRAEGPPRPSMLEMMHRQQQKMQERNSRYFKRLPGLNEVRIMPSWRGPGEPWWTEVPTHQNVGPPGPRGTGKFVTCQTFFDGADCRICEYQQELFESSSARDLNEARALTIKYGLFCNVARNEPDGVIKPWNIPQTIYNFVQASFANAARYGANPLHSRDGYDLIFTYNPQGKGAAAMYPHIEYAQNPSPIVIVGWKSKLPNLDHFWEPMSKRQIQDILDGKVN